MLALGEMTVAIRKYDDEQHGICNEASETDSLVKRGYQVTGTAQSPLTHGSFYVHGSDFNIPRHLIRIEKPRDKPNNTKRASLITKQIKITDQLIPVAVRSKV
jgi:hypothetical protein